MSREAHVRFWESAGVRFPRATRHHYLCPIRGANIQWVSPSRPVDFGNIPSDIFSRTFAQSALFKKKKRRERRTLDPQVART